MLAAIKGLSRHKRSPPHDRRESAGQAYDALVQRRSRVPPIYSTVPLTAAPRGGVRKASGQKGVCIGRSPFDAPAGGVEQKGVGEGRKEALSQG